MKMIDIGVILCHHFPMLNSKQCAALCMIFAEPTSPNVKWNEMLLLLKAIGAVTRKTRSGVMVNLGGGAVFGSHRPHPDELLDKAAATALRKALTLAGHVPANHGCSC